MAIPCLIVAYSRVEGISRLISTIDPLEVSQIYLALDGPKSKEVSNIQSKIVRSVEIFCSLNSIPLKIWKRDQNVGVAKSIIASIEWFFHNEEFGVVLEDDLEIGNGFFKYIEANRVLLETHEKLLLISGNQFMLNPNLDHSVNWSNYPLIWGWATSRDRWKVIKLGILDEKIYLFNKLFDKVENFWRVGTIRVRSEIIDTWDIPLAYFMIKNKFLCLLPDTNLVSNRGNDVYAQHTLTGVFPLNIPTDIPKFLRVDSVPNLVDVHKYNLFLESRVFKVRFRHHFNYIYFLIFIYPLSLKNLNKLAKSLKNFKLPINS
jgi:hypothetical protein